MARPTQGSLPPVRGIIFDMDGTLYQNSTLEKRYIESAYQALAEKQRVSLRIARQRFQELFQRLTQEQGRPPSRLRTLSLLGVSDIHWAQGRGSVKPETILHRDIRLRRTLQHLHMYFRLGLVTNNHRTNTLATLRALGIEDVFDEILTLSESRRFKPAPELYRMMAQRLHLEPVDCLSVGDRYHADLAPAARVGMHTLLVQRMKDIYRLPGIIKPKMALRVPMAHLSRMKMALWIRRALRNQRLVIIPTDTVYGLASQPSAEGIRWLFRAKGRAEQQPIVLLLSDMSHARRFAAVTPFAKLIMKKYWPGALTLVLPVKRGTPWGNITRGKKTIALRVPDHALVRQFIRRQGGALAVTSANPSGQRAPWKMKQIDPQILAMAYGAIYDDPSHQQPPSTIAAIRGNRIQIVRQGSVRPAGTKK
jgi:tRNA threonylcarbamoyl adenosine modification protein (Sua5/YciO/YrdC/YwlC family)